jgi:glycosyltransferase involved in cell wall biosynthesis
MMGCPLSETPDRDAKNLALRRLRAPRHRVANPCAITRGSGGALKIAMVIGSVGQSSAASEHGRWLPGLLSQAGHQVTVYRLGDEAAQAPPVAGLPASEVVAVTGAAGELAAKLDSAWERDRPDVVQAHSWPIGLFAQLAADRHGLPTVQSFHGTAPLGPRVGMAKPAQTRLAALVARTATWVTTGSSQELETVARLRRSRRRTSVIACGIDVETFGQPPAPGARPQEHGHLIAGLAGSDDLDPGFDAVIRTLPAVPDVRFLGIGRPLQQQRLDAAMHLARALGVQDRVELVVLSAAEALARLEHADIATCTPALCTDHSTALQAMAAGIPLIAHDTGALADTVIDDVTGLLIQPGRPRELAAAIKSLLAQPFQRMSMGAAGRARARSRYSWQRVAQEYEWVYESAMTSGAAGAPPLR